MLTVHLLSRRVWFGALALGAVLTVAAACGEDGGAGGTPAGGRTPAGGQPPVTGQLQPQPQPAQELSSELTGPVDGVIAVGAGGIAFGPNNLKLPLGQAVTIRVANNDPVRHSLRIAGVDGQYETEDDAVTEPAAIGEGETGELNFSPQIAGVYSFRCDFHPDQMGGQIVVE